MARTFSGNPCLTRLIASFLGSQIQRTLQSLPICSAGTAMKGPGLVFALPAPLLRQFLLPRAHLFRPARLHESEDRPDVGVRQPAFEAGHGVAVLRRREGVAPELGDVEPGAGAAPETGKEQR